MRTEIKLNGVSLAELSSALKYSGLYVEQSETGDYAEIKAIPAFLLKDRPQQEGRALENIEVWEKLGEASGVAVKEETNAEIWDRIFDHWGAEPQSSEEGK